MTSRQTVPASLFQRALTDLERGPDDVVELFGPANVRHITIGALSASGCKLEGDPETIERLVGYATPDIEAGLREWAKPKLPRLGRPRNDLFDSTIYAAAFHRFLSAGLRKTAASEAAAKWLGQPATKDRVEKNTKRFYRAMTLVYLRFAGLDRELAMRQTSRILLDAAQDLERLEARIAQESAAALRAKKAARHASFSAQLHPSH